MSITQFNTLIHAPKRLQLCALLAPMNEMEFKTLRNLLDVSDSVLSKHLKLLEEATYVSLRKRTELGRQRTWIALTASGRKAYKGHVKELKKIVG